MSTMKSEHTDERVTCVNCCMGNSVLYFILLRLQLIKFLKYH